MVEAVEARLSLSQMRPHGILAPVHEDFRKSGMTEAELDTLLTEERSEARAERPPDPAGSG